MTHFFIRKVPGYKISAIRINSKKDIPNFLKKYVRVDETNVYLNFKYEKTAAPLSSVIIYNYLGAHLSNCSLVEKLPENIFEKDGIFYEKSPIMQATKITDGIPSFMENAKIKYGKNSSYVVQTRNGVSLIKPGYEGYFCLYGYSKRYPNDIYGYFKDNKCIPLIEVIYPDSYKEYIICDEDGNYVSEL